MSDASGNDDDEVARQSARRWFAAAAVVALLLAVAVVIALAASGDDDGGSPVGQGPASPPQTTRPEGGEVPRASGGCDVPDTDVLERIGGKATDLVDFTPAQSATASDGTLAVTAPVRPATSQSPLATWLVRGDQVTAANDEARNQSSFPPARPSEDQRAAAARAEACVRDALP